MSSTLSPAVELLNERIRCATVAHPLTTLDIRSAAFWSSTTSIKFERLASSAPKRSADQPSPPIEIPFEYDEKRFWAITKADHIAEIARADGLFTTTYDNPPDLYPFFATAFLISEQHLENPGRSGGQDVRLPAIRTAVRPWRVLQRLPRGGRLRVRPSFSFDHETSYGGDMFTKMRAASYTQRSRAGYARYSREDSPSPVSARDFLTAASTNGVKAAGPATTVGSLTPGKESEMVLVRRIRRDALNLYPCSNALKRSGSPPSVEMSIP